jgi:hypothetical protein
MPFLTLGSFVLPPEEWTDRCLNVPTCNAARGEAGHTASAMVHVRHCPFDLSTYIFLRQLCDKSGSRCLSPTSFMRAPEARLFSGEDHEQYSPGTSRTAGLQRAQPAHLALLSLIGLVVIA